MKNWLIIAQIDFFSEPYFTNDPKKIEKVDCYKTRDIVMSKRKREYLKKYEMVLRYVYGVFILESQWGILTKYLTVE